MYTGSTVGNQSPLPLIDLPTYIVSSGRGWDQLPLPLIDLHLVIVRSFLGWESVTSPFDRLTSSGPRVLRELGISHLSL